MILLDMQFQVLIEDRVYPTLFTQLEDVRYYAHELARQLGVPAENIKYQWRAHVTSSTEWVDVGDYPDWEAMFTEVNEWVPPSGLKDRGRVSG